MKPLYFISAQPTDLLFVWQIRTQLFNFRQLGYSHLYRVLVFVKQVERLPDEWKQLEKDYPEASFYYYLDTDDIQGRFINPSGYIGLLRPYLLSNHYREFPHLKDSAIFYIDSDILFTEVIDFTSFISNNINYGSCCRWYISATYFDSKVKDVLPGKVEAYKQKDILQECIGIVGLTRQVAEKNEFNNIGAQYLLKGIDHNFWVKVFADTIRIYLYLKKVNSDYFESEDKGFQSFCADMWALLWNLWKEGKETKTNNEFNFSWSTSKDGNESKIFHDAGITKQLADESSCPNKIFFKHDYKNSIPDLNPNEYKNGLMNEWYVTQIKKAI